MAEEERQMNALNRGRCSRCIASKKESREKRKENEFTSWSFWLRCVINENWCRYCAMNCKEPPMGISAEDYIAVMGEGNLDGEKMPGSESTI